MPGRGMRRAPESVDLNAGRPTWAPEPSPAAVSSDLSSVRPAPRTRAFTARLDSETDDRYERLTRGLRDAVGLIGTRPVKRGEVSRRSGYAPSRGDLLRALLTVADRDPDILRRVQEQVRIDLTSQSHDTAAS